MNTHLVRFAAIVVAVAVSACAARVDAAADGKDKDTRADDTPKSGKSSGSVKAAEEKPKVLRFKAAKKAKNLGVETMSLLVEDPFTGRSETIWVPNNTSEGKEYDPKTEIREVVEGLEAGAIIEVVTTKEKGKTIVSSLSKAEAKPGEELPNGFVFVQTRSEDKGGVEHITVVLSKFGREIEVGIPMFKDDEYRDAKWEPDPKIDSVVRRLQSGAVVEATFKKQANRAMIAQIVEYRKPERGKFGGLKEVDYNNWPAAGFEVLAEDGTTITFTVPGTEQTRNGKTMYVPNPQQLAMVKRIRKDADVEVRYTLDGRKWMLLDIRPLPATATPATKIEKKPASKNGKAGKETEAGDMKDDSAEAGTTDEKMPAKPDADGEKDKD